MKRLAIIPLMLVLSGCASAQESFGFRYQDDRFGLTYRHNSAPHYQHRPHFPAHPTVIIERAYPQYIPPQETRIIIVDDVYSIPTDHPCHRYNRYRYGPQPQCRQVRPGQEVIILNR